MRFKTWVENQDQAELMSWLQGSVLVENGQPMVLYHGTNSNPFKQFEFRKGYRGVLFSQFEVTAHGIFLSESYTEALTYGRNVVACHARMLNPLVGPRRDKHLGVDRLPLKREMDILKILGPMVEKQQVQRPNPGAMGTHQAYAHFIDLGVHRHYITPQKYNYPHEWIYAAISSGGIDWDALDNPQVVTRMKSLGYDGTFVSEREGDMGRSVFLVSPDQVRIIDWNNKTRDPNYEPEPSWDDDDDF
jgi:hypothetical protein